MAVDEKKNKSARAFIFQANPEDVLLQIAKKKSTKDVWDCLKTRYIGADHVKKARLQTLKSELEALRMKEGETIDEFSDKLRGMAAKFAILGATLEDATLVKKLLDSAHDKFFQLVASIEQYSDLDAMPFEEAIGRLKPYEERILRRGNNGNTDSQLLLTQAEWQARQQNGGRDSSGQGSNTRGNEGRGRGKARGRGRGLGKGGHGGSTVTR